MIFTFWEPRGAVVPYIALCMKTWPRAFAGREVVVLDHARVREYLDEPPYDMDLLRRLPLPIQKDAITVAVLRRHGGVFLDADTLAVGDVAPLVDALTRTEVVMIAMHMAVVAARPGARLLDLWYAGIEEKLAALRDGGAVSPVPWDFTGNSVLLRSMDALVATHEDKPLPLAVADHAVDWLAARGMSAGRGAATRRVAELVVRKRRALYFRTIYRPYLTMLDRDAQGFMPELLNAAAGAGETAARYRRYWFESDAGVETALRPGQALIGLHHSWTPPWYTRLSEAEVLAHPCLLSRTLRHLLER